MIRYNLSMCPILHFQNDLEWPTNIRYRFYQIYSISFFYLLPYRTDICDSSDRSLRNNALDCCSPSPLIEWIYGGVFVDRNGAILKLINIHYDINILNVAAIQIIKEVILERIYLRDL